MARAPASEKLAQNYRTGEPDLKKLSIILGSAFGVLLVFSVISYAQKYMPQDPKPAVKLPVLEVAGQIPEDEATPAGTPSTAPRQAG